MAGLADFRAQYPQYNDIPDTQLADSLYSKLYSDMPRDKFNSSLGLSAPTQPPPTASDAANNQPGYVASAANSYLGGVSDAARSGFQSITHAFTPSASDAVSMDREKYASPFDISGEINRLGSTGTGLGRIASGALQIVGSPIAPLISGAGKALDAVTPSLTQDQQRAMGVTLPSGEEIINKGLMGMRPGNASPAGIINKTITPAAADVKAAATNVYQDANVRGTTIPRQSINNVIAETRTDFRKAGFRQDGNNDAFGILDEMEKAANPVRQKNGQFSKANPVTADDMDAWSSALGNTAKETQLGPQGLPQATPRAAAAAQLKSKVDDLLSTHAPGWSEADSNYAAAKTAEGLDRRSNIAEVRAGGGDYAAKLAQQAKSILLDPRVTSKFSTNDLARLREVSQGGSLSQQTLNWLGTKLGSRISHGAGALIGGLLGASHGGAEGAVIGGGIGSVGDALLSKSLMAGRNKMAGNQVQSLINSVLQNSPYGKSLPPTPVSAPNPLIAGGLLGQFPNILRPQLGLLPSYANGQQ